MTPRPTSCAGSSSSRFGRGPPPRSRERRRSELLGPLARCCLRLSGNRVVDERPHHLCRRSVGHHAPIAEPDDPLATGRGLKPRPLSAPRSGAPSVISAIDTATRTRLPGGSGPRPPSIPVLADFIRSERVPDDTHVGDLPAERHPGRRGGRPAAGVARSDLAAARGGYGRRAKAPAYEGS